MSEQVSSVDDRFFNEILTTVNPREANERILNAIIIMLKHDDQIMEMCKLAKLVMRSARFSKEMLEFEIRMLINLYIAFILLHVYVSLINARNVTLLRILFVLHLVKINLIDM